MSFLSALENGFEVIAQCGVLFLECIGVVVLLSGRSAEYRRLPPKRSSCPPCVSPRHRSCPGIQAGGEVLRTAIVREPSELVILGAIILLRGALTFLIHWEIKTEESRMGV